MFFKSLSPCHLEYHLLKNLKCSTSMEIRQTSSCCSARKSFAASIKLPFFKSPVSWFFSESEGTLRIWDFELMEKNAITMSVPSNVCSSWNKVIVTSSQSPREFFSLTIVETKPFDCESRSSTESRSMNSRNFFWSSG